MLGVILTTAQRLLLGKIRPIPLLRRLPNEWVAKTRPISPHATPTQAFYLTEGFKTPPVHCPKTR